MAKEMKKINMQLQAMERNLKVVRALVAQMERESHKSYENVPGVVGTFDGVYMVTEGGEKYEVSPNYAAKSRLVYGSKLKMVEEDGRTLFKQVDRKGVKEVRGIISKKEGQWYALADCGSYRISDVAARFNNVEVNDEVLVLVPEDNLGAPYAALRKVIRDSESNSEPKNEEKPVLTEQKKEVGIDKPKVKAFVKETKKPFKSKVTEEKKKKAPSKTTAKAKSVSVKTEPTKKIPAKEEKKSADVGLGDDDLR